MGLNPEQIEAHQSCNKLLHSAASYFYLSRSKSKQKRVLHMSEFGSIVSLLAVLYNVARRVEFDRQAHHESLH